MAIDEAKLRAEPRIADAFRTGEDIGRNEHNPDVFFGSERCFRPGYCRSVQSCLRGPSLIIDWRSEVQ